MAQDSVGRRHVKKELRYAESQQQGLADKLSRRAIPECEHNFLFFGAVDLIGSNVADEFLRRRDACLEFG